MSRLSLSLVFLVFVKPLYCQDVEYYHLDAIGNIRVVTDQNGTVVERHDYLPFGEECSTGACASNPGLTGSQPRRFTGKERDAETGLDYFGARYYRSAMGRFTTVDPLVAPHVNLTDPQGWNRYSYARNNPLRYLDPDGRLTIIIPGTWAGKAAWAQPGSDFNKAVSRTFGESAMVLPWNHRLADSGRRSAAETLKVLIETHTFREGEALNIVAHSHGGNVAKIYTRLPGSRKIDVLVNLGTPQKRQYDINEAAVGEYLNVFSRNDHIQLADSERAVREDLKAINNEQSYMGTPPVPVDHSDLHSPQVWEQVEKGIH